ncbi:MAG: mechanosensitive ion channel [Candidatus Omnitrophica bacterium]|nr:mechanosensitive ion channel [Candidatus Omnitrophota bacterium]
MSRISKKISWEIIKKSILPLIVLVLFIANYVIYRTRIYPLISEALKASLKKYIATAFIICAAFIIHRIVSAMLEWYRDNIAVKTTTTLDDELIPIARRTLKLIIWVVAFLVILPFYGVNISALITALGVSSLAIALAAQDTIANIIAGFLIMIDKPFTVKDKIKIPTGEIVEVLSIGVRRSRFLAEDKSIIIVPNLDLSKSKIVNYTYGEERKKA